MHDPVSPVVVKPSIIGWDAKERKIALQIDRAFTGEELVKRMKGWITVDPSRRISEKDEGLGYGGSFPIDRNDWQVREAQGIG
jgi:hypothetical protein